MFGSEMFLDVCVCCRSRLADFFVNCQPEPRSLSGCLKENYADCLLAYSGLIGEFTCTLDCYFVSAFTPGLCEFLICFNPIFEGFSSGFFSYFVSIAIDKIALTKVCTEIWKHKFDWIIRHVVNTPTVYFLDGGETKS